MRRRGNKSSKVPGVKLRPADKGAISRPIVEDCWAQETQPASDDTTIFDACPRPLKGVVICATGLPDKPTLFKQAVELGATCTPAFTDRVTHLVAVVHGGAKYTCALERKIPILKPSWITDNYQIWLKGDDPDIHQSVEQHRLPIFSEVVVCPSGITDIVRRTNISKLVVQHDGTYSKNLERPVKVTHLLCSGDEETEKMRYAEKFNSRGEANIHMVWEEWFWDSLDFGGKFDEADYQVTKPRPERRVLAATPPPPSSQVASQHDEEPSSSNTRPQDEGGEDEPAFANVLPAVTLQLWGGLLGRRGYQVTDGEVLLSPSKDGGHAKAPSSPPAREDIGFGHSVISSFRRANSFAPAVPVQGYSGARQLPFRRTTTAAAAFDNTKAPMASTSALPAGRSTPTRNDGGPSGSSTSSPIFAGMRFRALGEAKSPAVRKAVEQLGGRMASNEDEDVDFIIVRLVSGSKIYRQEDDETLKVKYRTECWLEQCMYEDRICPVDGHVTFVPLAIDIPVAGAEKVVLSLSGFDQSESFGLKRLLRALGINVASTFSRRSTHLLCPSGTGLKFEKAKEWGIPVINVEWLAAISSEGRIPPVHDFLVVGAAAPPLPNPPANMETEDPKGKRKADKGNGRAVSHEMEVDHAMAVVPEVENRMNDITNNRIPPNVPVPPNPPDDVAKKIERQATTLIPEPEPPEKKSFGVPHDTLGGSSFMVHPSSICTPSRSLGSSVIQYPDGVTRNDTRSLSFVPNPASSLQQRQPTLSQIDLERQEGRVPSSKSPSPMKGPLPLAAAGSSNRLSLSPVKIDNEATKALQDSITSLLGKRRTPEGEIIGQGVPPGRQGKRARPQRGKKLQSRQASNKQIAESSRLSPVPVPSPSPKESAPNAFESYQADTTFDLGKTQDQSLRVMYEDPGQRDEKKRLMSLLKTRNDDDPSSPEDLSLRRMTRSSARIAGF